MRLSVPALADDPSRPACFARGAALQALLALVLLAGLNFPSPALAEQASQPLSAWAGQLDTGQHHSCAIVAGLVRCWGYGAAGELGLPDTTALGDNESPGSAGPIDLGEGNTAVALSAGAFHTCAILADATVRCWGFGADGRLGYGNTDNVGDDETPAAAGPVDLGEGRTAKAISAGLGHTCAVLSDDTVRCWGYNLHGQASPGSLGSAGSTVKAISAGAFHTCAILGDDTVRCWGYGGQGRLGYGPAGCESAADCPIDLGSGHTAKAISAGIAHTCAVLDDDSVRCWGNGTDGALGYAGTSSVGDDETPGQAGPVNLGTGRSARAISAGQHTCATLDTGDVRCWGRNRDGQLGYGHTSTIGDNETPASVAPVNLGAGRTARAISAGELHTCARLDDGNVRCWGKGANGRLGYCSELNVGDNEAPALAGPVNLDDPSCPPPGYASTSAPLVGGDGGPIDPVPTGATLSNGLDAQAARRRALRTCYAQAARHTRSETRAAGRLSGRRRTKARRHAVRHRAQLRRRCLKRYGRRPGRVTGLTAQATSRTRVTLAFSVPGTDGSRPPAAHTYVVKQSRRPIRTGHVFRRAQTLCNGSCRFPSEMRVGARLTLAVTDLRPRTTYYYAVAARDNVSRRLGPRSRTVKVRTP